jgi:hypothetical protein
MVRPGAPEAPLPRLPRGHGSSGLKYRYRARMTFRENPVGGLDSFGSLDGIRVFYKGSAAKLAFGKPLPCAVALAANFGFAVPLAECDEDVDALEDLGEGDPIYGPTHRTFAPAPTGDLTPSRAPVLPRPGTPLYPKAPPSQTRPLPPPAPAPSTTAPATPPPREPPRAWPSAPMSTERTVDSRPAFAASSPSLVPAPRLGPSDVQRDFLRALEGPAGGPLREALAQLADGAASEVVAHELEPLRQLVTVRRKELGDARSDLANVSKELRAVKQAGRDALAPVPKPVPQDANAMTDDEIQAQIVHQLHKNQKWGKVYTSVKNFQRGYNAKVDEARVRRNVKALVAAGVLLKHAKGPDETYSLNPHQKGDVARILGIGLEEIDVDDAAVEHADETSRGAAPQLSADEFVERTSFDHTVRGVKDDVAKLANSLRTALDQTAPRYELSELANRLAAIESQVAQLQNAITEQAEKLQNAITEQAEKLETAAPANPP